MKITSPMETESGTSYFEEAVEKFEEEFKKEDKDQGYYHLSINCEYNRAVCDEIQNVYTNAGWKNVKCKTSSEKGERGGFTGLQLWK